MSEINSIQNLLTQVNIISKKYEDLELEYLIKQIEDIQNIQPKSYSLREISKWQLEETSEIKLPSLQRGFVWKANQIETLWDSILRGYPIGAVMMSVDSENNDRFLLDGQQRSTSIALGFLDPFDSTENHHFFSLKDNAPTIWIDLLPLKATQNQVYNIKVLTKSHPWGYKSQRDGNGNGDPLEMKERKKALAYFTTKQPSIKRYIDFNKASINPWDANYPVPLSWLLNTDISSIESFKNSIKEKIKSLSIKTQNSNEENVDFTKIEDLIFKKIFEGVQNAHYLLIPEISVKSEILKNTDDQSSNSEDPTLFVRLNSSGTRIGGEELMYSMYKAAFPLSKDLVENIGKGFIAPSKIINLFSRLVDCKLNNYSSLPKDYKINKFKDRIKDSEFRKEIENYIHNSNGESIAQQIIQTAIEILNQGKVDNDKVPAVLIKQWITNSADLLLVLLIYIEKNNLYNDKNELQTQLKTISANFVYVLLFANDIKTTPFELFDLLKSKTWQDSVQKLIAHKQLKQLIPSNLLRETLLKIVFENKFNFNELSNIKNKNLINNDLLQLILPECVNLESASDDDLNRTWTTFIHKIYWNKSFLLYAQRKYINDKFDSYNQIETIDDTNRPWDWDHIYPQSHVYQQKDVNKLTRQWVNSNGNFRALSYDDNRSENNNNFPSKRFINEDTRNDSFVKNEDYLYWQQINNKLTIETTPIFLSAVIIRMVNIYDEWLTSYYN